ncbi:hypothetical protein BHE74_00014107 [Ensete ventricosum]|nr:hypothetical protein BHE74_00014107 [Ensete ventricosum]
MDRFAKVSHLIVQQVVPQEMDRKSINEGSMLRHLSKVGTPQLQTRASLQGQQAWWVGTVVSMLSVKRFDRPLSPSEKVPNAVFV